MSRGKRYSGEAKLNYKKVLAVTIAIIVFILAIIMIKKVITKAKDTKPIEITNYFAFYKDEKWGVLNSNGETVIEPMYQEMPIIIDKSKDVFLCTYDIDEENGTYKTKVVNKNNEEIWQDYEKIQGLENFDESENVWYEENCLKALKNGKWGLISIDGKEISEFIYDDIQTLKGVKNSIIVQKDGMFGLLNSKGNKILDTTFSQIQKYGEEENFGFITINQENKYGLVNLSGDKILENNYEKIENIYNEKYFAVVENGKQILVDKQANKILEENFDEIKQIASSGIIFTKNNLYGLMNYSGETLIEPNYEVLKEINTDIFSAKKDGKIGVIDKEQNAKVAFSYKEISYNKKAGIYIAENEEYVSSILNSNFEIKLIGILSEINVDNGYMKIKIDDTYKYYNFKFQEKDIKEIFPNNKIYASYQDSKYGFIDSKGNKVIDYIYDEVTEVNEYGFAAIKKDGLWGAIDKQGSIIIEPTYNLNDYLKIDFIGKWHLGLNLNMNYYCDK